MCAIIFLARMCAWVFFYYYLYFHPFQIINTLQGEKMVSFDGKTWHMDCFVCWACAVFANMYAEIVFCVLIWYFCNIYHVYAIFYSFKF